MPAFLVNWKTTLIAVLPLIAYGLKGVGVWPESMPLPPLNDVWPALLAVFGVGVFAKDNNVTGGKKQQ
jgi:hypothetical protein